MRLRISANLRGELNIPTFDHSYKANSVVEIEDKNYFNDDVQMAIRKGFVIEIDTPPVRVGDFVRIRNISGRLLNIPGFDRTLIAGENVCVPGSIRTQPGFSAAVERGWLTVEDPSDMPQVVEEEPALEEEPEVVTKVITERTAKIIQEVIAVTPTPKAKPKIDMPDEPLVEKAEEEPPVMNKVTNMIPQAPHPKSKILVKKGADGNSMVAWNPNGVQPAKKSIPGAVIALGDNKFNVTPKAGQEEHPQPVKMAARQPDPMIFDPEKGPQEDEVEGDEAPAIEFVDQEQKEEKVKARKQQKGKQAKQNEEVE